MGQRLVDGSGTRARGRDGRARVVVVDDVVDDVVADDVVVARRAWARARGVVAQRDDDVGGDDVWASVHRWIARWIGDGGGAEGVFWGVCVVVDCVVVCAVV